MSAINLFTNFYVDKNPERQKELEYCALKNLNNPFIDRVVWVMETQLSEAGKRAVGFFNSLSNIHKTSIVCIPRRPTFNDYFGLTRCAYGEDINIISNTDIYFDESVSVLHRCNWKKHCLALTRWDEIGGGIKFFNRPDSQDCWIFKGPVEKLPNADFNLGKPGCDNRIAQVLEDAGYNVINPGWAIRSIHVHNTRVRNYTVADTIPPPYKMVHPTRKIPV